VDLVGDKRDRENLDRFRTPVETIQWSLARRLLSHGLSVVLENGFWQRDERVRIAAEARALPCRVELHFLDVPRPLLEARIADRNVSGGQADIPVAVAELDEWLTWFEPPDAEESVHYDRFEVHTP
jgi:predicted kinase